MVPNPAPMAYGIIATSARTVNALKDRPLDQNVAVSLHDRSQWQQVAPCIDLSPAALDAVVLLLEQRLSVLVPLGSRTPPPRWVTPAVRDGYLAAFNGYWTATARLWERFPRLYGSSANITGDPPVASAARAVAVFGADCAVVDGAALDGPPRRPPGRPSGPRFSSTMVRIDPGGRLDLYRTGAQDVAHGHGPGEFLRHLASAVGLEAAPAGNAVDEVAPRRR